MLNDLGYIPFIQSAAAPGTIAVGVAEKIASLDITVTDDITEFIIQYAWANLRIQEQINKKALMPNVDFVWSAIFTATNATAVVLPKMIIKTVNAIPIPATQQIIMNSLNPQLWLRDYSLKGIGTYNLTMAANLKANYAVSDAQPVGDFIVEFGISGFYR